MNVFKPIEWLRENVRRAVPVQSTNSSWVPEDIEYSTLWYPIVAFNTFSNYFEYLIYKESMINFK